MHFKLVKNPRVFQNQLYDSNEKQPTVYHVKREGMTDPSNEYEVVECEIGPAKIVCPDCGGITLEGLDYCDKCGGELSAFDDK